MIHYRLRADLPEIDAKAGEYVVYCTRTGRVVVQHEPPPEVARRALAEHAGALEVVVPPYEPPSPPVGAGRPRLQVVR